MLSIDKEQFETIKNLFTDLIKAIETNTEAAEKLSKKLEKPTETLKET